LVKCTSSNICFHASQIVEIGIAAQ
jgi:hypothetical protein